MDKNAFPHEGDPRHGMQWAGTLATPHRSLSIYIGGNLQNHSNSPTPLNTSSALLAPSPLLDGNTYALHVYTGYYLDIPQGLGKKCAGYGAYAGVALEPRCAEPVLLHADKGEYQFDLAYQLTKGKIDIDRWKHGAVINSNKNIR